MKKSALLINSLFRGEYRSVVKESLCNKPPLHMASSFPPGSVFPWDAAQLGLHRLAQGSIQQACAEHLAKSLAPTSLPSACQGIDKAFCSVWLDQDNVLVGSKCNILRQLHIPSRTWQNVVYPAPPVHRLGPDLLATAPGEHSGQHSLSVSPSGTFVVTGGTSAEDIVLWRMRHTSTSTRSSSLQLQPVQTFMGHADWVFGMDWLSDRHWVSGGRDGTIKLWQVPEAAEVAVTCSPDPAPALLSLKYHEGKVRDIKYDQEREQVVALSTDNTLSWWTPDLQLKGSCRLEAAISDPVALATCGDVVAVGSSGSVHLLDTRIPDGGLKRSSSSCNSLPNSKRSRLPFGRHDTGLPPAELPPASWEAAAAGVAPALDITSLRWLPEAYYLRIPAQPVLLAAARTVTGMQQLQESSVAAGIDPVQAEQLLRQEAASTAVTSGRTFDAALQELVGKLLQLSPQQQRARLGELQLKQQHRQQDLARQNEQHLRLQVLQQQQLQQQMILLQQHQQQQQLLQQQHQQHQQLLLLQQHEQLQEGGSLPPLMVPVIPGTAPVQPLPSIGGVAPATAAGAAGTPAGQSAGYGTDDEDWSSEAGDDSDEEDSEPLPPGEAAWQQWQERVSAITGADRLQHPAHAGGHAGAGLFPQHTELISQVRHDLQPAHGPAAMTLAAAGPSTPLALSQAFLSQHGLAPAPSQLRARVSARLAWDRSVPVRSVSMQNSTILGVGHNDLDFYDLRRLQGLHVRVSSRNPDSSLLYKHVDMRDMDPVHEVGILRRSGYVVYSHCWGPSGTQVLAAGGALTVGDRGAFVQLLT